jgi:hypothetical protein
MNQKLPTITKIELTEIRVDPSPGVSLDTVIEDIKAQGHEIKKINRAENFLTLVVKTKEIV